METTCRGPAHQHACLSRCCRFVDLGAALAGPTSVTVVAYVVSGVGFLGAGAIIKDGAGIRGMNTAATLWCSAAVGDCCGAGELLDASFIAALLMVINLLFRPLSRFIDRHSVKTVVDVVYRLHATCSDTQEAAIRLILVNAIAERPLIVRQLRSEDGEEDQTVRLHAEIEAPTRDEALIDQIVSNLRQQPSVLAVR